MVGTFEDGVLADPLDDEVMSSLSSEDEDEGAVGEGAVDEEAVEEAFPGGATLQGTDSEDTLIGTDEADVVDAGAGNDFVWTHGGDDVIEGGAGYDAIYASNGNDRVWGSGENDFISGGKGNDSIWGGDGDDVLNGNSGDDMLLGGAGNDVLSGTQGNDMLNGGSGDDLISGGSDNDTVMASAGNDIADGGSGFDTLDFSQIRTTVELDVSKHTASYSVHGQDYTMTNDSFERFVAGDDGLNAIGSTGSETFVGGAGEDSFRGKGGRDVFTGGEGADTYYFFKKDFADGVVDHITDFQVGEDALVLTDIDVGFESLSDAVRLQQYFEGVVVEGNLGGQWVDIAVLDGLQLATGGTDGGQMTLADLGIL